MTKTDHAHIKRKNYPDLTISINPRTTKVTNAKCKWAKGPVDFIVKKKRNLDPLDASEIILANNSYSKPELLYLAKTAKNKGKTGMALYILRNTNKIEKLIKTTWDIENSG